MTTAQPVPEFVAVAQVGDIPSGQGKMVRPREGRLRGKPIAIFNENGTFHIINYICPHMGGPISEGTIENGVVTCPWHAWTFYAQSGLPDHEEGHPIVAYESKVEGDDILVGWIKQPRP